MGTATMKCDVCGAPATHMVRDSQEVAPDGFGFRRFEPCDKVHLWCDKHVRKSQNLSAQEG